MVTGCRLAFPGASWPKTRSFPGCAARAYPQILLRRRKTWNFSGVIGFRQNPPAQHPEKRKPREVRGAWIRCTLRCRIFLTAALTTGIGINIARIPILKTVFANIFQPVFRGFPLFPVFCRLFKSPPPVSRKPNEPLSLPPSGCARLIGNRSRSGKKTANTANRANRANRALALVSRLCHNHCILLKHKSQDGRCGL